MLGCEYVQQRVASPAWYSVENLCTLRKPIISEVMLCNRATSCFTIALAKHKLLRELRELCELPLEVLSCEP